MKSSSTLYEFRLKRCDGTLAEESFTAVSDKSATQKARWSTMRITAGGTYKLLNQRDREVVHETAMLKLA